MHLVEYAVQLNLLAFGLDLGSDSWCSWLAHYPLRNWGQYNRDAIAEAWSTAASAIASTAAAAAQDGIGFMEWELAFR